jgi:DNA polymerase-3 subunit epsilon
LAKLAKEYGLPLFEQHNALEDALQTAYLFVFLAAKLREQGLSTFRHLRQASEVGMGDDGVL